MSGDRRSGDGKPDAAATDAWLARPGHHLLDLADPRYPRLLRDSPDPPAHLFVAGDPAILGLPQLAIVGSRNATATGRDTARDFAAFLAARGFVITSGLAEGIDGAAHQGALAGGGLTVAVCGTGLDVTYPRLHEALAHDIVAAGGALVSEFPPGTAIRRHNFPRRNRIIAGLAAGTLVVEASTTSGALITARFAAEAGREVFAIPGSIHNPLSRGCHHLIREGAKLVETASDIVEELGGLLAGMRPGRAADDGAMAHPEETSTGLPGEDYAKLLDALGWDPVDLDTLVPRCGLTTGELSSMLLILEMHGFVRSLSGGRYQRIATTGE